MKPLSKSAAAVLNALTRELADPFSSDAPSSRTVDLTDGVFMPVVVERIGPATFSVGHYYTQNGDRMSDPEMTFWRSEVGSWHPVTYCLSSLGVHRRGMELDDRDQPKRWSPREYADQRRFATTWMRNIKAQQGGVKALCAT